MQTSTRKRGPELDDYDFYTIPVTTRPVDHSNSSAQRRLQGDENIGTDAEERRTVKNLQRASWGKRTEDLQVPLQMHGEPCVLANILGNGGYITRHQQVLDQMATSVKMTLLTTWRSQTWFRPSTGPVGLEPELCLVATTTIFEFICKITSPGNMRTRFPPEQQVWQLVSSVKRTLHGTWNPNQARLNTGPVNIFQRASWGKRTGDLQVPLQMHREPCVLANILGNGGYITRHQQVLDQKATSVKMTLLTTWRSQTWFRPSTGPVGLEPELCLVATTTIFEFICKITSPGNMRTRFPPEQQVWQLVSSVKRTLHGTWNPNQARLNTGPVNIFQRASWGKRTGDLQVPLQMHREPCVLANILGNGGYITRHQQVLDQKATSVKMTLLTTWRSQTWFRPSTGPVGLEPELCLMTTTSIFVLLLLKTIGQGNMGTSFPPEHNMHQLVSSVKRTLHRTCSPNQVRPNPAPGGGQPGQCLESVNLSSPSTLLGNQQRVYVFLFIIFFLVFSIFLFK
ncbi:uncharacterized protein LOC143648651 isoform X3 [Tamandua tetradactyla]|uniref:uncharacterized protein LOC143648651 isoform X3 n=1 Tax=Tamandua tetradactyla TaxID=48850 RepID=UPI004053B1CC